jgi:hypothetical protein
MYVIYAMYCFQIQQESNQETEIMRTHAPSVLSKLHINQ